jgi:ATP-binding cassette subfamily F protein uup
MMVLIKNPNFLILDEPTNDLDLITLEKLEDFLSNFGGCLIIVSHDRYFMDNLVEHFFVFEGNGVINDFNGTYSEYRAQLAEQENQQNKTSSEKTTSAHPKPSNSDPEKLSFNERKEYQKLEKEIQELEKKKTAIQKQMSNSELDYEKLQELSETFSLLKEDLEEKELLWLELAERA